MQRWNQLKVVMEGLSFSTLGYFGAVTDKNAFHGGNPYFDGGARPLEHFSDGKVEVSLLVGHGEGVGSGVEIDNTGAESSASDCVSFGGGGAVDNGVAGFPEVLKEVPAP
jgi:hypothetical protein